jgi:hypothetical protein
MTTEDQKKLDHIKKTLEKAKQHCRLILSEEDSRIHYSVWIDEDIDRPEAKQLLGQLSFKQGFEELAVVYIKQNRTDELFTYQCDLYNESGEEPYTEYMDSLDEALNKSCKSVQNRLFNMFDIPKAAH